MKIFKGYKSCCELKYLLLNFFVTMSGVMLFICYQQAVKSIGVDNVSFMAKEVIPCIYALCIVAMSGYLMFKAFYKKDCECK